MSDADDITQPVGVPFAADAKGTTSDAGPFAGWYVDPSNSAQHRYWDGASWTAQTFPNGPSAPGDRLAAGGADPIAPFSGSTSAEPVPAPSWTPVQRRNLGVPDAAAVAVPSQRRPFGGNVGAFLALAVGLVVGFALALTIGAAVHHRAQRRSPLAQPAPPPPSQQPNPSSPRSGRAPDLTPPSRSPGPADPASSVLAGLVVGQGDVGPGTAVRPLGGGTQLDDPTLDLCNASFPSESARTARLQVVALNGTGDQVLSTEAVLYRNSAATAQGFGELKAAMRTCPTAPVTGPGGDTSATRFNPSPDVAWPATATVERLAFDFTTTDVLNQTHHDVAVYLRRGRVLEGIYFFSPDGPQPPVAGQTSLAGITAVFAARIAALPASAVDG
ncbi:MAG: hypothetical protein NVS3B21_24760 [Acidimicrobiales bacterium]